MNMVRTVLILGGLTGLLVGLGYWLGGPGYALVGLGLAAVVNVVSYWFSDTIVLKSYRAQPLEREEAPRIHAMVEEIAARAGMPVPRIYRIPTDAPNAFATGRNPEHAAVAVTDGIRRLLDEDELKGVLAHELAHVRNRDILISSIAATLAGALMFLSRLAFWFGGDRDRGGGAVGALLTLLITPVVAMILQMAVSRSREYGADETGARWVGPRGLASALRKLDQASKQRPMPAHASSAHLFIAKPAVGSMLRNLFSTHPPMEKRIARLLDGEQGEEAG